MDEFDLGATIWRFFNNWLGWSMMLSFLLTCLIQMYALFIGFKWLIWKKMGVKKIFNFLVKKYSEKIE